ncbi:MAG: hypothetical protein AAGD38_16570 [Acidobacteriota bacterium]
MSAGRWTARKLLMRALVALVALQLLWLVGVNLMLRGPLADLINRRSERTIITWDKAWSWYPGHVEVDGFRLRSQSPRMQTEIRAPRATGRIGVWPLIFKRVVIRGLEVEGGVVVRARHRLDSGPEYADQASFMPPIEGLENPPDPAPEDLYPPSKGGWAIVFVDAGPIAVGELWIDGLRSSGGIVATGSADVVTRGYYRLRDVAVDLAEVTLQGGDETVAENLSGRVAVAADAVPMRSGLAPGEEVTWPLDTANLDLDLTGRVVGEPFFDFVAGSVDWLRLPRGYGDVEADIEIVDGVVQETAGIQLDLDDVRLELASVAVEGASDFFWSPSSEGWRAEFWADDVEIATLATDTLLGRSGQIRVELIGEHRQLDAMQKDLTVTAGLSDSKTELTNWTELLPLKGRFVLTGGTGTLNAAFEASTSDDRGTLTADLDLEDFAYTFGERVGHSRAEIDLRMPVLELDTERYHLDGTRIRIDSHVDTDPPWFGEMNISDGRIEPGAATNFYADGKVELADSRVVVALILAREGLPQWLGRLVKVRPVDGRSIVSMGERGLDIGPFEIAGDRVDIRGILNIDDDTQGLIYARYRGLSAAVEMEPDDTFVKVRKSLPWFEERLPIYEREVAARRP